MGAATTREPVRRSDALAVWAWDRCSAVHDYLGRKPAAFLGLVVFLVAFSVFMATAQYSLKNQFNDAQATIAASHRFAQYGDFTLDEYTDTTAGVWLRKVDDRHVSNRFPGIIFWAIPFYWAFGGPELTALPSALASATASALTAVALFAVFRRLGSNSAAVIAALVAAFATSTWGISSRQLWTHTTGQLWAALAMLALAGGRELASGWWFGLGVFTRPQTAFIPAVVGVLRSWKARSLMPGARVALGTVPGLVAFVVYGAVLFRTLGGGFESEAAGGSSVLTGGYSGGPLVSLIRLPPLEWLENLAGILVAPSRGTLLLSPFLVLLLIGIRSGWRNSPDWARQCAVAGLVYLAVQMRLNYFDGGGNQFVYRLSLEALTLCAPVLFVAFKTWVAASDARIQAFVPLVAVSVAVQFLAATAFYGVAALRIGWSLMEWTTAIPDVGGPTVVALLAACSLSWLVAALALRGRSITGGLRH